ncbi:MAG: hypothetical protein SVV03_03190 [Candidatus Nanohaloarchaea archaeon]|nr:hypothetical protein [Candidatus Nanohaloarchaea archaeon]
MNRKTIGILVVVLMLTALSTTAISGLTVDPDLVDDVTRHNHTVKIVNDGGTADSATLMLPAPGCCSDPFGGFRASDIDVDTGGWSISWIQDSDGDGRNDTVRFSTSSDSLSEDGKLEFSMELKSPSDGSHTWKANLSNGEEYSTTVVIDGSSPETISLEPKGEDILHPRPEIVARFQDEGRGVDDGETRLKINGESIDMNDTKVNAKEEVRYKPDNLQDGENTVELYLEDGFGHGSWNGWSFSLAEKPKIPSASPAGITRNNSPVFKANLRDPTGIDTDNTWIRINGDKHGKGDSGFQAKKLRSNGTFYRLVYRTDSKLKDGEHDIQIGVQDSSGDWRSLNWTLTVDTTSPTVESLSLENGEVFSEKIPIKIKAEDTVSKVKETRISIGSVHKTIRNATFSGYTTVVETEISTEDLDSGESQVEIEIVDNAGNSVRVVRNITVDKGDPEINSVHVFPNPTNVAPTLRVKAGDPETPLERAEYFLGIDPGMGKGKEIPVKEDISTGRRFKTLINTSGLSPENYTLGIRVQDQAQHWSDLEVRTLTYNPALESELQFNSKGPFHVKQGERKEFDIYITNTGKVPGKVNLSYKSGLDGHVAITKKVIGPGNTRVYSLVLQPGEKEIGNYSLELEARSRSAQQRKKFTVVLKADKKTRERIRDSLEELKREYSKLENLTDLWAGSLDPNTSRNINSSVKNLSELLSTAEKKMDRGNYRYAERKAPELSEELNRTRSSLKAGMDRYYSAQIQNSLLAMAALILLSGVVTLLYIFRTVEDGFGDQGFDFRPEGKHPLRVELEEMFERFTGKVDRVISRVEEIIEEVLEEFLEEEEGWQGFEHA